MSKQHSKKRNSALLYEFLVRSISRALVEGDKKKSSLALKILRRNFKQGTELFKEFRLMNSLVKTTVSSQSVASSILTEAKKAARSHDVVVLDREKSILIKHINHSLNEDGCFYDVQIDDYKTYATVQQLINNWRTNEPDLGRLALFEDSVVKMMTSEKQKLDENTSIDESPGMTRLLMKVMTEKLNEKYGKSLNNDQKALVRTYALASVNSDMSSVKKKLQELRDSLLSDIETFKVASTDHMLVEKLESTSKLLLEENFDNVSDETVSRFMVYSKLKDELVSEDK